MSELLIKSKQNSSTLIIVDGVVKADLCRCGQSKTMPTCDDTHKTCGFKAEASEIKIQLDQPSGEQK